ncbi:DUF3310 domain-containing protein [Streptomyces sp. NPDC015131]|uniref:DUF3310 domain-containing protein n=1 Tax=Streptomyces sp. NPDC015131 TaxID=3364941 RepID=UPI00370181B5
MRRRMAPNPAFPQGVSHSKEHDENAGCPFPPPCKPVAVKQEQPPADSPYEDSFKALDNGASPSDPSTAPKHYQGKAMQPWQIWEAYDLDPWAANVIKYVLRAGRKGPKLIDLQKARHYLDYLIEKEQKT